MPAKSKVIRYTNIDGKVVEKEYWFQLGNKDFAKMELAHMEKPGEHLTDLVKQGKTLELMKMWEQLLFKSVSIRKGDVLVKNDDIVEEFEGSGAYEEFFSELIARPDAGFDFFISIMPDDIQKQMHEERSKTYSNDELLAMSDEEFEKYAGPEKDMSREMLLIAMRRRNMRPAA